MQTCRQNAPDEPLKVGETDVQFDPHVQPGGRATLTVTLDDPVFHYVLRGTPDQMDMLASRLRIAANQARLLEAKARKP